MKTAETTVTNTSLSNSKVFKIVASAKSFSLLSDKLYKDQLTAILRELGTNAYDAHVEAKKADIPFIVTLPNSLEPTLTIEDTGIGMSSQRYFGYIHRIL
jgi:HSP90 family molecular chaperone